MALDAAKLISVNSTNDGSGNGPSRRPQSDSPGQYVVFESDATNLVSPNTSPGTNIFVRFTTLQSTTLLSVNSANAGVAGNGPSIKPRIAIYSRLVVFESDATDLVTPATSGHQLFARLAYAPPTTLVSVNSAGNGAGNGSSHDAVITPDGRYVVFLSNATNLVSGIAANGLDQVYIRDLQAGVTKMVSVDSSGLAAGNLASLGPLSVSDDGQYVAFTSNANNLGGTDGNGLSDVYLRDVTAAATSLVSQTAATSVAGNGASFGGQVSRDGSLVMYTSLATDLQIGITDSNGVEDVYLWYRTAGFSQLISSRRSDSSFTGNGTSTTADGGNFLSFDGIEFAFRSNTTDVVNGISYPSTQNNVIGVNNNDGFSYRVDSADPPYTSAGDAGSTGPISLSYGGEVTAYQSDATNLAANDTNDTTDVFAYLRFTSANQLLSRSTSGQSGNGSSSEPFTSDDGLSAVFSSRASDLDPLDSNGNVQDIFQARICSGFLVDRQDDAGAAFPGSSVCQAVGGGCTLRAAVDAANSFGGGQVCLPGGTYLLDLGRIDITSGVTIDGDGNLITIIDGQFNDQIFNLFDRNNTARAKKPVFERGRRTNQSFNVTISNVQIVNGLSSGDGGAIEVESGVALYLNLVNFNNNNASDGSGGAVAAYSGSELHVFGSAFDNNIALDQGGAVWCDGLLDMSFNRFSCNNAGSGFNSGCGNNTARVAPRRESSAARARPRKPNGSFFGEGGAVWVGDSAVNDNDNRITDAEFLSNSSGSQGGAVYNNFDSRLTLDRVTAAYNDASSGSGIYNQGNFTGTNCTVSQNTSFGNPGTGFSNGNTQSQASLANVTLRGNSGGGSGREIESLDGTTFVVNTVIAGDPAVNCAGIIASLGHNIENGSTCGFTGTGDIQNTDPKLDPALQYNGGFEQTHMLLAGSPAVDAGDDKFCPPTDQRFVPRPQGVHCDMGAVEMIGVSISDVSMDEGNSSTTAFVFTLTLAAPNPNFSVSVDYATADGTATLADNDYTQKSGTVTFPFGAQVATITVPVVGDNKIEPNETFFLNLSNATGGVVITDSQGVGTIVNDDGGATFLGPTPYLSKADSPFLANINAGLTYLETMECGLITVPGVTPSGGSVISPSGITDSVDADDGAIDGFGTGGHSFFFGSGPAGIDFTFSAAVLGALPTEAGIVWTDGAGTTTFEAFDAGGTSLGMVGPVSIADFSIGGTTGEDNFFGVRFAGGISRIRISNSSGGIEVDHLQYGLYSVVTASADLSITKSDSPDPVATGAALTYTLNVSNAGPSATCAAVTVTDTLPAGVSFVSASGAGWSCAQSNGVVTCIMGSLVVGAAPPITIQVTAPSSSGSITNSAVVASQTPDPVSSNNTATATTTVGVQPADLQATKTGPATVTAGANVVYSIIVRNNGPGDASAVTVSDATPAGLTFVSNSGACVTAFPCSLGTVNNGQMLLITSTFSVPLSYAGPNILNTASVSSTTADPTPGNNSSTATTTVTSGPPSLSIGSVAVVKPATGTITAVFPVTLSSPSASDVTVSYASADGTAHAPADYQAVAAVLTIPAGTTSSAISVLVNGNVIASDDKFFTVVLYGPANAVIGAGAGVGTGLIQDRSPLPSLSIGDVNVTPGGTGTTPAVFPVTLSGPTARAVSVNYHTTDGTATAPGDYSPNSGTVFFAPGETSKTITVDVVGKPFVAPSNFFVDLSPAVNATVADSRGTASINRAFPSISVGDAAVQTPGSAVFLVTLTVPSTQPITVSFTTQDRTAFAGIDYTALSGVLTFAPGETTKTVTVLLLPGGTVFPTKVFRLILSNPSGAFLAKALGEAAIYDQSRPLPPGPYIYIDDVSVVRPGSSFALYASVPVRLTGPSTVPISLSYSTRDGSAHGGTDYLSTNGTLTIAPGETLRRILVPVLRAPAGTPGRNFKVSLASALFGDVIPASEATVSIIPPSP